MIEENKARKINDEFFSDDSIDSYENISSENLLLNSSEPETDSNEEEDEKKTLEWKIDHPELYPKFNDNIKAEPKLNLNDSTIILYQIFILLMNEEFIKKLQKALTNA